MFSSHRIDVSGFDDVNLDVVKSTFSRLAAMKVWLEVVFTMSGSHSMAEQQKQVTAGTRIAALTVDKRFNSCHCSCLLACPHRVYLPLIERRTNCLVPLHSKTLFGVTCAQIGWKKVHQVLGNYELSPVFPVHLSYPRRMRPSVG